MVSELIGVLDFILKYPELGWILAVAYLAYELRGRHGRIYKLDKKMTSAIIVIRALSRAEDTVDEDTVDEYLVENGMEPEDFIAGESKPPNGGTDRDFARSDGQGSFDVNEVIGDDEG